MKTPKKSLEFTAEAGLVRNDLLKSRQARERLMHLMAFTAPVKSRKASSGRHELSFSFPSHPKKRILDATRKAPREVRNPNPSVTLLPNRKDTNRLSVSNQSCTGIPFLLPSMRSDVSLKGCCTTALTSSLPRTSPIASTSFHSAGCALSSERNVETRYFDAISQRSFSRPACAAIAVVLRTIHSTASLVGVVDSAATKGSSLKGIGNEGEKAAAERGCVMPSSLTKGRLLLKTTVGSAGAQASTTRHYRPSRQGRHPYKLPGVGSTEHVPYVCPRSGSGSMLGALGKDNSGAAALRASSSPGINALTQGDDCREGLATSFGVASSHCLLKSSSTVERSAAVRDRSGHPHYGISFDTKGKYEATKSSVVGLSMSQLFDSGLHAALWVAAQDGTIEIRSMADPNMLISVIPKKPTHTGVTALLQLGQNKVVVGQSDGFLRVFNAYTLEELFEKPAHSAAVACIAAVAAPAVSSVSQIRVPSTCGASGDTAAPVCGVGAGARVFLTGSLDGVIAKWDSETLECLARLQGSDCAVSALTTSLCGCYAFSGCERGVVRMWNLDDDSQVELSAQSMSILADLKGHGLLRRRSFVKSVNAKTSTPYEAVDGVTDSPLLTCSTIASSRAVHEKRAFVPGCSQRKLSRGHTEGSTPRASFTYLTRSPRISSGVSVRGGMRPLACLGADISVSPFRGSSTLHGKDDDRVCEEGSKSLKSEVVTPRKLKFKNRKSDVGASEAIEAALRCASSHLRAAAAAEERFNVLPRIRLASCFAAGFHDPADFNWPLVDAHHERISSLLVVENRLLITASRDGAAKVFGLPAGVYLRTLTAQHQTPLSGVVLDTAQCRLLVGMADGGMLGFDLCSGEMPLILQTKPLAISFTTAFVPIRSASLYRFFFVSSTRSTLAWKKGKSDSTKCPLAAPLVEVTSVAQHDRTSMTRSHRHGFAMHHIGEPSPREWELSQQEGKLQAKFQANKAMLPKAWNLAMAEAQKLRDIQRCASIVDQAHARHVLRHCFLSWHRWLTTKRLLTTQSPCAPLAPLAMPTKLLQYYWAQWARCYHEGRYQRWSHKLAMLQSRGGLCDVAIENTQTFQVGYPDSTDGRARHRRSCAAALACWQHLRAKKLVRRVFYLWTTILYTRYTSERREEAFNRLLLSFNGTRYDTSATAWSYASKIAHRAGQEQRVCWLAQWVAETSCLGIRRHYYTRWKAFVWAVPRMTSSGFCSGSVRRLLGGDEDWSLVSPSLLFLARREAMRAVCFRKWRCYAVYTAKHARICEEILTLRQEWKTLEGIAENPSSLKQLKEEALELESGITRLALERVSMEAKERIARGEVVALQMAASLRTLLGGFIHAAALHWPTATYCDRSIHDGLRGPIRSLCGGGQDPKAQTQSDFSSGTLTPRGNRSFPVHCLSQQHCTCFHPPGRPTTGTTSDASVAKSDDGGSSTAVGTSSVSVHASIPSLCIFHAVMLALKGVAFQCARDERAFLAAHDLAIRLPIPEPSNSAAAAASNAGDCSSSWGSLPTLSASGVAGANHVAVASRHPISILSLHNSHPTHQRRPSGGTNALWNVTETSRSRRHSFGTVSPGSTTPRIVASPSTHSKLATRQVTPSGGDSLAKAFDTISQQLFILLSNAARDTGVDLDENNGLLVLSTPTGDLRGLAKSSLEKRGADGHGLPLLHQPLPPTPPTPTPCFTGNKPAGYRDVPTAATSVGAGLSKNYRDCDLQETTASRPRGPSCKDRSDCDVFHNMSPPLLFPPDHAHMLRWTRVVPSKVRREIMGLVVKLLVLYDCFIAHSETSVEAAGSISIRGASVVRPLPASCLCSEATVTLLTRHAAVLLELLHPRLRRHQEHMQTLANTYLMPTLLVPTGTAAGVDVAHPHSKEFSTAGCAFLARALGKKGDDATHVQSEAPSAMSQSTPLHFSGLVCKAPSTQHSRSPSHHSVVSISTNPLNSTHVLPGACSSLGNALVTSVHHTVAELHSPDEREADEMISFSPDLRSVVSTPRSLTSHSRRSQYAASGSMMFAERLNKPYLGFRVNVSRDEKGSACITLKEIASTYVNVNGEEMMGPAAAAGLQVGDQLHRFAGYIVTDLVSFNVIVSRHVRAGAEVPVVAKRQGETINTSIIVGLKSSH